MQLTLLNLLLTSALLMGVWCDCAFDVDSKLMPFWTDRKPFSLVGKLKACVEYMEEDAMGCCNEYADQNTKTNFEAIDGLFGSQGGGCDICAINLKRFWCEYACSARQSEFMTAAKQLQWIPDPGSPGSMILAQQVNLTIFGQTACALFRSCKRNPFVASVSAMGSPAGFLTFQGHNAVDSAHQLMNVVFSDQLSNSLALSNLTKQYKTQDLNSCDYKAPQSLIHSFQFKYNCTCNTCEETCDPNDGFKYTEPEILEDFNSILVGGVWLGVIAIGVGVTVWRNFKKGKKE